VKWYEKIWKWIKKYWGVVLSAVTLATDYFAVRAKATYKQISLSLTVISIILYRITIRSKP